MKIRQKYNVLLHGIQKYGKDWPKIRKRITLRDGGRCRICGSTKNLHIHHIIPWKISHSNEDLNLVTVCRKCHPKIEKFAWLLLEEGAHRFQIYEACWKYIENANNNNVSDRK